MPSSYPVTLDNFSTSHVDNVNETVHALDINNNADAVNHIEAELGTLPKGIYSSVAARLAQLEFVQFNSQNVTAYTLVASDQSKCVTMINASPSTVTVPLNASVPFPIGTVICIRQGTTAGQITIQGATGVTIKEVNNSFQTQGPVAYVWLIKQNTDFWDLIGATA